MRLALASALLFFVSAAASDAGAPGAKVPVSAAVTLAGAPEALSGARLSPRTRCISDLLHPIEVEALLVDGMTPGQWLRAVVRVRSRLDLAEVRIDLDPVGAAELAGPHKAAVAEIAAERPYEYGFDVRVPDTASPQQVRIRISGSAEGARIERGTVLHLLPRGITDPGIASPVLSGTQRVLEQRGAARRMP